MIQIDWWTPRFYRLKVYSRSSSGWSKTISDSSFTWLRGSLTDSCTLIMAPYKVSIEISWSQKYLPKVRQNWRFKNFRKEGSIRYSKFISFIQITTLRLFVCIHVYSWILQLCHSNRSCDHVINGHPNFDCNITLLSLPISYNGCVTRQIHENFAQLIVQDKKCKSIT